MSKWVAKSIVQKIISFLPYREKINHFFQKYITKGVYLDDEHFGYKVQHAADHVAYFNKYGKPNSDSLILELGTGWYPIIPILFYLTGTGKTISIDIQSWMNYDSILYCIRKLKEWETQGKLAGFGLNFLENRWSRIEEINSNPQQFNFGKIKEIIGLENRIVDARETGFESNSFDFICSNNTFEHIHEEVLPGILIEFKRILRKGGVMSHFIDMSDHFAHFDKKITIYNFLKFSKRKWKLIDNRIQPQNRWRLVQYKQLYDNLNIPITEQAIRKGNQAEVSNLKIHAEFQMYSIEDLAISHAYLISQV